MVVTVEAPLFQFYRTGNTKIGINHDLIFRRGIIKHGNPIEKATEFLSTQRVTYCNARCVCIHTHQKGGQECQEFL